ncbi:hypothetical protein FRB98_000746 [Tulasnella sp. 332]|nr:hypothetical protein FRB98_000746 [Tulasnella sp. 332]
MSSRRRSSRLTGHSQNEATASGENSSSMVDVEPASPFAISLPPDVSEEQLYALLPESMSLEQPSPESIVQLYRLVIELKEQSDTAAADMDDARAEAQRKEVELDQALMDHQNETIRISASLEQVSSQVNGLKLENAQLVQTCQALKKELDAKSSSNSASSHELEGFQRKLEETERANRDLIEVVDRMKGYELERQLETDSLRERLKAARSETSSLQTEVAEMKSHEATTKFKLETLEQELTLLRNENERHVHEYNTKSQEAADYRRSTHKENVALQMELDSIKQPYQAAKSQLESLRQAHTGQTHQYTQALQKINQLKDDNAEQETKFREEQNKQARLINLLESRNDEAKRRVEEVENEWEKMVASADDREAQLKERLHSERMKSDALEQRVDDMRAVIDKLGSGELPVLSDGERGGSASVPGTPRQMSLSLNGPAMFSPTANLASKFQKTGRTFTEVYADYVRMQAELASEKQESSRLSECLAQILADIEERAPLLQEQRVEYERIQRELQRLGPQLAEALQARETESRNARVALDRAAAKDQENMLLKRQLSDIGHQVKHLLREIAIRDNPSFATEEQPEADTDMMEDVTDTDKIITDSLTLFRNTSQLQDQNQRLLRVTREMAAQMEKSEKETQEAADMAETDAVRRAKSVIESLHAKIKSQETTERALRKEIDMLAGMLVKFKQGGGGRASAPMDITGVSASSSDSVSFVDNDRLAEMSSVLKEMGANTTRLQDDLNVSQKQIGQLNVSLAKANAQVDFLSERHRISEQSNDMQKREFAELQNRHNKSQSQLASLEIACHQAQDQVRELNGSLDRLRHETVNLRAEKGLLKDAESRLVADNHSLNKDNIRLNSLLRDTQTVQGDAHRAAEMDRRRLESQLQSLEGQTQDLRTQLSKELDRSRHLSLQREVEVRELHTKIETAAREASNTREQLMIAQTNEKHLTARVEELVRTLEGLNEKLAVYERRPSTVNGVGSAHDISSAEELQKEVAELRSALKTAEIDLETAQGHVEQFQNISSTSEQALADLQIAYDEYRLTTDSELEKLKAESSSLQLRIQDLDREVVSLSDGNADLRRQLEEQKAHFNSEKADLEHALADVNGAESKALELQVSVHEDLRRQAQLAEDANNKYNRELVAHAEAVQIITQQKHELNVAQAMARDQQTAAETAQANLLSSQTSWDAQRETLNKELQDLKSRFDDMSNQNATLHKHLESVSSQATAIRQAADQSASLAANSLSEQDADAAMDELRSVIAYLRKEKEIVDLQLDLNRQQSIRLRSEVEHLTRNIEETRAQLAAERAHAANTASSAVQHSELLEKINQLNILRESNTTLRAETEGYRSRVHRLEEQLSALSSQLDPLQSELRATKAEVGANQDTIKMLEGECDRWRTRNAQLLTQYKQVDPEDLRLARDEVENLRKQTETSKSDYESLQASKDKLYTSFQSLRAQSSRIIDNQKQSIAASVTEKEQLTARIQELESGAVEPSNHGLETLRRELAEKTEQLSAAQQIKISLEAKLEGLSRPAQPSDRMDVDTTAQHALTVELEAANVKIAELQTSHELALQEWQGEKASLDKKIAEEKEARAKHFQNAKKFSAELKVLRAAAAAAAKTLQPAEAPTSADGAEHAVASEVIAAAVPEVPAITTPTPTIPSAAAAPVNAPSSSAVVKAIPAKEPVAVVAIPATAPVAAAPTVPEPLPVEVTASALPEPIAPAASSSAPTTLTNPAPSSTGTEDQAAKRQAMLRERLENMRKAAKSAPPAPAPAPASGPTTNGTAPAETVALPQQPSKVAAEASANEPPIPTVSSTADGAASELAPPSGPRGRGRGRGISARGARGGAAGRGRGAAGQGAAGSSPITASSSASSTAAVPATTSGLSISGAAKRPLEDQTEGGDASGAKRVRVQRNRQPGGAPSPAP